MSEHHHNRVSKMNFGEQLLGQDVNQFQMNNTWVPITPEKLILLRSNTVSDWPANQLRRLNYQEFHVSGSDYVKEMLMPYRGTDQNLHLIGGQTGHTGECSNFGGNSVSRNCVINQTACSFTQPQHYESNGLNNNTLELLLRKNATSIANANMNFDASINMAARNPLLPNFYPWARSDVNDFYAGVQRWDSNSVSDIAYKEAKRLMIPNRNSEFIGSNLDNFLNNDIHNSVPYQLNSISSVIPYGDSYHKHNLNYVPIAEADATASFTNLLQSIPETMDQLKFVENQAGIMPDYTIVESTSHEKDLVSFTENEIQEYCDGLLQQIVESSSAVISTTVGDQQDSVSNICDKRSDEGFDLNKTPGKKEHKRRKHRPKVIVEAKPKRNPNSASQKTKTKENPRKKRNSVPKSAATPKADVIKETFDSTTATRKTCRKSLKFDLEKGGYESQSRTVFQQEIQYRNENAFNATSALLISQQDELIVENQQPGNTNDITIILNEKVINPFLLAEFQVTEKAPAQGNHNLCKERFREKKIGNTIVQSEACCENSQKTGEPICQNTLQSMPNILPNSSEAKGSKRKYSNSIENQSYSARNPCGNSLCQEILQMDGNCNGAPLVKGFSQKNKRKRTKSRLSTKVCGRSSSQIMSKDDSHKVRKEEKNRLEPHYSDGMPNYCIESCNFVEQQNNGTSTRHCFAISGQPHQIDTILVDDIICQMNGLNLNESNTTEIEVQNALVPYKGDGSIVLYQEFELAKKHKPRPKVDLDPETERTWKLLMGKEGSEGLEETNKKREKWWEEERNLFRGRVDSFIARMHLVQGDRRFSKWKGSVVDSVIGVFLTQNVSDHLSSSAFMSLAARFPLKSKSSKRTYDVVVTDPLVEEPELCIVNPADKIISYGTGTLNQPTYYLDFQMPHHTGEHWRDSETSRINDSPIKPDNQSSEEEFLSSHDSLDSSITQDTGVRSSSGYNSESEGLNSGYEPSKAQFLTSKNSLQIGKTTLFHEFYHSVNGVSLFEEPTEDRKLQRAEHVKQSSRVDRNDSHSFHSAHGNPCIYGYPQKQQLPVDPSMDNDLHYSYTQGLNTSQMKGKALSWPEVVSAHGEFQDNSYRRLSNKEVEGIVDKSTEMQCGNGMLGSPELLTVNPYGPLSKHSVLLGDASQSKSHANYNQPSPHLHLESQKTLQSESRTYAESSNTSSILGRGKDDAENDSNNLFKHAEDSFDSENIISTATRQVYSDNSWAEPRAQNIVHSPEPKDKETKLKATKARKVKTEIKKKHADDWDKLRKEVQENGDKKERSQYTMDSLDYEALRCASVEEISKAIRERGMNNMLAERMKEFLNRLVEEHGSIDLEWLRHVPPDQTKDYLLSIRGLGLKSVECVRLLTLHHLAFPVDTNVGRIAVRLGWVPLQPLPEELQIHLLEMYPVLESVQKYLWPRLCKLDQRTLYELHYQMITFGKVFCTKKQPNCNACPMRAECRHFASAFASARLALPGPEEKRIVSMPVPIAAEINPPVSMNPVILPLPEDNLDKEASHESGHCEPIIEEPATPEQCTEAIESDIEDFFYWEDPDELPKLDIDHQMLAENVQNCMQENGGDLSKAIVAWTSQSASIPTPKLKNVSRLRTEHQVYELPDSHPLLENMHKREPDDPSPYLLAIWSPGETTNSNEPPQSRCGSQDSTDLCNDKTCFSCNGIREANSQVVRGTLLIPCRTATRGSFPLNGTYFQVNELFADHASSIKPIDIPREWIWNLPRRTVYFGTSVSSIFKGLSTQEIQRCFWRGFVCVRGFDQQMCAPRPLQGRLHYKMDRPHE